MLMSKQREDQSNNVCLLNIIHLFRSYALTSKSEPKPINRKKHDENN